MDVIRHDDVSSNQPRIGSGPGTAEQRISIGVSKYWLSILRADRHKYDYRGIELFTRGQMQWVLTIRVVHCRRDDLRVVQSGSYGRSRGLCPGPHFFLGASEGIEIGAAIENIDALG